MFDLTHNDLHTNNVMFKKTDKMYLYYRYQDKFYKVPTFGRIYKIIDFGRAIYKFQGKRICSYSFHKKGDAATLKIIIKIFQKEGFKIINSMFFNPELILKKGNHTKFKPNNFIKKEILKGKNIIYDLKEHEVGQAVVIRKGYVIAIESSDGTDAMLNRACILLNRIAIGKKKDGILLKFPKLNQDLRIDLPTVGLKTIKKCAKIGLKGIVVKANQNIFLDKSKCINLANKNKMFISAI